MKKISIFTIIFTLLLLIGCSSAPIRTPELQETLNENGEIIKIYTKSKITENGNTIILNGISKNNEFTGTKENVLFGGNGPGYVFTSSILEVFESNKLKEMEYRIKLNIAARPFWQKIRYFEKIMTFAKVKYEEGSIEIEIENIEKLINPEDEFYKSIPWYNHPEILFLYKKQKPEISKKLSAVIDGKSNKFTEFNYFFNGEKVNVVNWNEDKKIEYIEELSIGQMIELSKFVDKRRATQEAWGLAFGALQNSLNQYQQNRALNNSTNQYNNAGDVLKHRMFLIKHGGYIEGTEREARQNAITEFNNNNRPRY